MSYDAGYDVAAAPAPPPKPRVLPAEVNNFVTMFWLALGFGALLLLILWPDVGGFMPFTLSLVVLFAILAGVIAIGAWVSRGITLGNKGALAVGKMVLLVGMIAGLVGLIIYFVLKFSAGAPATPAGSIAGPGFIGASPLLGGSLLAFACLLPLFFALMGFFMSMRDEIDHYFNPPAEDALTATIEPILASHDDVAELLDAEPAEAEIAEAEAAAQEASDEVVAEQGLSPGDAAAMEDHEKPLSMGELSLDDEPAGEKKEEKK